MMKLKEVQKLLDDNGIQYILKTKPSKAAFYKKKGFSPYSDSGAFHLITIPNPNHEISAQLIFADDSENARFVDLEFGGFCYEFFDYEEDQLAEDLLTEIQDLMSGTVFIIFAKDTQTGKWLWDGMYFDSPDEEQNSMEGFHRAMEKIKRPKSWWQKLTGRSTTYEIYSWQNYDKIIK